MALLSDAEHIAIRSELAQEWSRLLEEVAISKPELKAAAVAIDAYFDDNAAAINNTLPAAAKAGLTNSQKSQLLTIVSKYRYEGGL